MSERKQFVVLNGNNLSLDEIIAIGTGEKLVALDEGSLAKCKAGRDFLLNQIKEGKVVYGVNSSYGSMCNKIINDEALELLQENLIRTHAAGLGEPLPHRVALAAVAIRLNSLVKGYSGVSVELLKFMGEVINHQIAPYIPTRGSVGASGDLIHLAHLALMLIGQGQVYYKGQLMKAEEALGLAGLKPFKLGAKEGISIINGTSVMTAIAAFAVHNAKQALAVECVAAAFAIEIFNSIDDFLDDTLHQVKPHSGQIKIAKILKDLVAGSKNIVNRSVLHQAIREESTEQAAVFETSIFIQNVYSIRCTPQVLSPVYEAIEAAERIVELEANSTNDNPVIISEENKILHGGNFHGQSIGFYMDSLAIALATLSNLSERRLNTLLDDHLNGELPEYLISGIKGLDMGFMGAQYLATSTTAENRQLANPVSTNNISSNASNQDVVSMGTVAARKVFTQATNLKYILTMEILADLQAMFFKDPSKLGNELSKHYQKLSAQFKVYDSSTVFHDMLVKFMDLLFDQDILAIKKILSK
ncbi:MAG: aromatic amino acid lyase [Firmicutes bacterium]|nr:aromatic amino acid lyase [Bacillota bacterium]